MKSVWLNRNEYGSCKNRMYADKERKRLPSIGYSRGSNDIQEKSGSPCLAATMGFPTRTRKMRRNGKEGKKVE